MVNHAEVVTTIRAWLQVRAAVGEITDDHPITRNGLLTSLMVVELVLYLEEHFGVTIDDEDVMEENFASIGTIAELVTGKLQ